MTPDQCTAVREHLEGLWLAAALYGGPTARKNLLEGYYGTTRLWRTDGTLRWTKLTRQGIRVGLERDPDGTLVATWREIQGHVDTLPADLAQHLRDAYAEHCRLWSVYCQSGIDADRAAFDERLRDTLAPLLDRALTYRPPVVATQPDIFDLLAEAS